MKLIDLHCDTIYECADKNKNLYENDLHISLDRANYLEKYLQCYAVWMPDEFRGEDAVQHFQKCMMRYLKETNLNKDIFTKVLYSEDLDDIKTKYAGILTVEGASAIGGELTNINFLYDCGVRIITLTWNDDNELAGGVKGSGMGFTPFGKDAVKKFEDFNITVDVSHLNEKSFYELCNFATKPFIATHSNLKRVCNHERNLTDDQFKIIKEKGGIVGLNFADIFLNDTKKATIDDLYKMTDNFLELGGEKTLSIGADFDGADMPKGISGIESMSKFYEYLLSKNYSEDLLNDIFYNNSYNFLKNNLPKRSK
jgi:membrane dipeptidase